MIEISPIELASNLKKYLDIAKIETVIIRRGKAETFVLSKQEQPADDLERSITKDELMVGIREGIKELFRKKNNQ